MEKGRIVNMDNSGRIFVLMRDRVSIFLVNNQPHKWRATVSLIKSNFGVRSFISVYSGSQAH